MLSGCAQVEVFPGVQGTQVEVLPGAWRAGELPQEDTELRGSGCLQRGRMRQGKD